LKVYFLNPDHDARYHPNDAQENINGRDQFRILVRAVGYTIHGLIPASCVFADRHGTYCLTYFLLAYNREVNIRGGEKTAHVVFKYFHAEACCRKGWGGGGEETPPPSLAPPFFLVDPWISYLKTT
jgi:hypothetical protein